MLKIRTDSGKVRVRAQGFAGGERHVQLLGPEWPPEGPTRIRADVRSSDDLMDLLLAKNALDEYLGERPTYLEIPYLPYGRQDRVCSTGQAFSLKVLIRLLGTAGFTELKTWDMHSTVPKRLMPDGVGIENVGPERILATRGGRIAELLSGGQAFLVRPDEGAEDRTKLIASKFKLSNANDILRCKKRRDPATGALSGFEVDAQAMAAASQNHWLYHSHKAEPFSSDGRWAVICDDICDGGGTFLGISQLLKETPGVAGIALYVTHGIFSRGLDPFIGIIDIVASTDSWPAPAAVGGVEYHQITGPFRSLEEES